MTVRRVLGLATSSLCALIVAGCAHASPGAGTLAIVASGPSGHAERLRESVLYVFTQNGNVLTAHQSAGEGAATRRTDIRADFTPVKGHPVLLNFQAKDTAGNDTSARYFRNGSIAVLIEAFPGVLQLNRVGTADASYRAVEKISARNATIVARMHADAAGNGGWTIAVYPRSAEAGTYYGFLSDAEMQDDLIAQTAGGVQRWKSGGEYAVGYDAPPPMRERFSRPAWFSPGSLFRSVSHEDAQTIVSADPIAGTLEQIDSDVHPLAAGGETVAVTDRAVVYSPPGGPAGASSIVVTESAPVPSREAAIVVREDVRRLMRMELAKRHVAATLVVVRSHH